MLFSETSVWLLALRSPGASVATAAHVGMLQQAHREAQGGLGEGKQDDGVGQGGGR